MTPAQRAAEIGLVNRAVADKDLQGATLEMARTIASKSSMTLATGKRAFYAQCEMPLAEAYDYASNVMLKTCSPVTQKKVSALSSQMAMLPSNDSCPRMNGTRFNYTSGTTGDPKGVVSHLRGAYLLAQGNALTTSMQKHAIYLWTLPMFHCNGWCFPWTLSAIIGTHVCLRQARAEPIWSALAEEKVTHLCGAPIVMSLMISAPAEQQRSLTHMVQFFTAAAPPPEKLLADMKTAGFDVTHLYGLTETYGPAVVNDWHES